MKCVGRDGMSNCRFRPVVYIGGDPACTYHIVPLTRLRLKETQKKTLKLELVPKGPWS
jgi:hypothetical protein